MSRHKWADAIIAWAEGSGVAYLRRPRAGFFTRRDRTRYTARMADTPAERKAAERERRKRDGWVRLEAWVKPAMLARIKRYISRIHGKEQDI